jgi:hypothetical protein
MIFPTFEAACAYARRIARKTHQWVHVYDDDGEWQTGSDYDADTFFQGQTPVATFAPDGNREH